VGGKINLCYNCVDRHALSDNKDKVAILWEGEPGETRKLTYQDLYREVRKFANVLKGLGFARVTGLRSTWYDARVGHCAAGVRPALARYIPSFSEDLRPMPWWTASTMRRALQSLPRMGHTAAGRRCG